MTIHLSPLNEETDYQRLAELITNDSCGPVTVERLRAWGQCVPRGTVRLQIIATNAARHIVGYAEIVHDKTMPAGHFHFCVIVDREHCGRGIGTMLYDDLLQFAREQGVDRLTSDILVSATNGLRFATQRGFTVATDNQPDCADYYRLARDLIPTPSQ